MLHILFTDLFHKFIYLEFRGVNKRNLVILQRFGFTFIILKPTTFLAHFFFCSLCCACIIMHSIKWLSSDYENWINLSEISMAQLLSINLSAFIIQQRG